MRLILVWLANAASLVFLTELLPSVRVDSFATALWVAVVLGLVNALLRPILIVLTLPVTILTLGLFLLVINGLMFVLVANLISGFHVDGLLAGVLGALLYSAISWALQVILDRLLGTRRA
jgi:putative membrane protein